jgi:hypothetical protein
MISRVAKRTSEAKQVAEKLGFVSGHDFSRAVKGAANEGF